MLHTRRLRPLLVTIVGLLALVGVTGAAASPSTSGSGTFTYNSCVTDNAQVDGTSTVLNLTCKLSYTGALTGSSIQQGPLVIRADGQTLYLGVEFFTGTVNGVSGTVTFFASSPGTPTSFLETNRVVHGSDGLTRLHGTVRMEGTVPAPPGLPSGTYTERLSLDKP